MKIGVISDTHGSLDNTKKALEILKDCDTILHLGDVLYHGCLLYTSDAADDSTEV